jgi:hypothetical protein
MASVLSNLMDTELQTFVTARTADDEFIARGLLKMPGVRVSISRLMR